MLTPSIIRPRHDETGMSEPHKVSKPVSTRYIKRLLDRNDPGALGELQRLAIGFRLATMETDAESVRRRMRKYLEGLE